jgi:hypothetical protein
MAVPVQIYKAEVGETWMIGLEQSIRGASEGFGEGARDLVPTR